MLGTNALQRPQNPDLIGLPSDGRLNKTGALRDATHSNVMNELFNTCTRPSVRVGPPSLEFLEPLRHKIHTTWHPKRTTPLAPGCCTDPPRPSTFSTSTRKTHPPSQ
jgi:hypothetical protein